MSTWNRWVARLEQREAADALALFRICVGLCVVGSLLSVVVHGLVPVIWHGSVDGGYQELVVGSWFAEWSGWSDPRGVQRMLWGGVLGGGLLVLGVGGRWTALFTLLLFQGLTDLNSQSGGSYDYLIDNALWLLVLGGGTQTYSLDCRLRTGSWFSEQTIAAWPRWLILYQLVLVYFSTGLHKLSAHWTPAGGFSALYYTLQQPNWQRFDMLWLAHVYPLTQLATAATWLFELTAPCLLLILYWRGNGRIPKGLNGLMARVDLRRVWVGFGVGLHLGIFLLMEVGPFSWIALAYYIAIFRGEEWAATLGFLRSSGQR